MATCSECTNIDITSCDENGEYWCDERLMRVSPCDPACNRFCEAYRRSSSDAERMRENYKSMKSGGGCYITTIVCDILGYGDDVYELQVLRKFRDSVLQKDAKYKKILATYDIVGPQISSHLINEPNREGICKNLFENHIKKVCNLINNGKNEEAINEYMSMTNSLIQFYNISYVITDDYLDNMDVEKSGHGRQIMLAR